MTQFPYREIFEGVERRLVQEGSASMNPLEIQRRLDVFKGYQDRRLSDDDYFRILVFVTFYSGFKASTVTAKRAVILGHFPGWQMAAAYTERDTQAILEDAEMIRHERKIQACVNNARTFSRLIRAHGSIEAYVQSHAPAESFENLILFKESLEATFDYLGGITVYHFMTDIGLPVLKPDRVITRIFSRLGLLENEHQLLKAVIQGRRFAAATGHAIRYIDIVLVAYGQVNSEEFGVAQGICLSKPRCEACSVVEHCGFAVSRVVGAAVVPT